MRAEVLRDIEGDTQIPQFYQEILQDLDKAESAVRSWDIDECFDIIWEINLDMLEMVDGLDDVVNIVFYELREFQKKLKLESKALPTELYELLEEMRRVIEKYKI